MSKTRIPDGYTDDPDVAALRRPHVSAPVRTPSAGYVRLTGNGAAAFPLSPEPSAVEHMLVIDVRGVGKSFAQVVHESPLAAQVDVELGESFFVTRGGAVFVDLCQWVRRYDGKPAFGNGVFPLITGSGLSPRVAPGRFRVWVILEPL